MGRLERKKGVTIKQVAEYAGVSSATVSHLMNASAPVSAETKERIMDAIRELNYVPNLMASSLRSGNGRVIQVLTPNMNNTFYTRVLSSFTDQAYQKGYYVHVFGYEYSLEREKKALANILASMSAAVIVFNGYNDEQQIKELVKQGVPVILADRDTKIEGVPYIAFDNKVIFREIIGVLKKRGYKRVGLFTEPPHLVNVKTRCFNFAAAVAENGYDFNSDDIFCRDDLCLDNLRNGCSFMKEILRTHDKNDLPDAWVTSSDVLAIGMMRAMRECGYDVPGDFGVVGFDNIDVSGYVNPRLTTVEQNQEEFGRALWSMVSKVLNRDAEIENIVLPQKLIIRESC